MRTLGHASHIAFVGDDVYVAAGHFGIYQTSLKAAAALPLY